MLKILNEHYYFDLEKIEKYISIPSDSGSSENSISVMKYEMVKLMTEIILSEKDDIDETLGNKSNISIPFKLAFNTLLSKGLINNF